MKSNEIVKKSVAKQTIDELAKQKKAEIDQTPNATKEEKDAAKQKVEEAVMRAKNCSKVPILTQMSIRLQSKVNNQLIVFKLKLLKSRCFI